MKKTVLFVAILLTSCKGSPAASVPAPLKTEEDKTFYALGLLMGQSVRPFNLNPAELEIVKKGMADGATGAKPEVDPEAYRSKVDALARGRATASASSERAKSEPFLDAAAKEPGAVRTPSGLVFRTLSPGAGRSPLATNTVKVHYTGTFTDGKVFDSSVQRGQPVEFPLNGVIACWTEGLQKMKVGEKAKLVCPSSIAYGDQGHPPVIPGGATLVFEVQLIDITR